jgi:hypothetical protein
MTMNRGEPAMRAEFERLLPLMKRGGFIPSVDHQTPPGVSLEEYRVYLRLLQEYMDAGTREPSLHTGEGTGAMEIAGAACGCE